MGMIRIFILLLAITNLTDAEKEDLGLLIEGLRSYQVTNMIGHVTVAEERSTGEVKKEVFLAREDKKLRYDIKEIRIQEENIQKTEMAYDGEKVMTFKYGLMFAPTAYISSLSDKKARALLNSIDYMLLIQTLPVPLDLLLENKVEDYPVKVTVKRVYKENMDGENCYVVEIEKEYYRPPVVDIPEEKIEEKVWVAPQKSFSIIRKEEISEHPGRSVIKLKTKEIVQSWDKYDEFWFPRKIVKEELYIGDGEERAESKTTICFSDGFKINVDVPDSIFCIKLPKGLKWFDTRIGKRVDQPN